MNADSVNNIETVLNDAEFDDVITLGCIGGGLWDSAVPYSPGHAEQSLVLMAAGMAYSGRRVLVAAPASPLLGRACEQIRTAVAMAGLPVCILGFGAGFDAGEYGAARQVFDDIALMRSMPGMTVFVPSDAHTSRLMLKDALRRRSPVYMRFSTDRAASNIPDAQGEDATPFRPESSAEDMQSMTGARTLRTGTDITICACGIMVSEALRAAAILERQDISAEVLDCCCISPFPSRAVLSSIQKTGCCVTAEEHFITGGLFEAVAGLAAQEYPVPVQPVAVQGSFGQSGMPSDLREYYGLTFNRIVSAAMLAWTRRRR